MLQLLKMGAHGPYETRMLVVLSVIKHTKPRSAPEIKGKRGVEGTVPYEN